LNAVPAASLAPELSGARLDGHLRLVCDLDAHGQCRLREQSFSAPVHLSKPHYHEETLILNVANPTAGFFAGDRLRVDVRVETGARLLLTAPSANRVHTMAAGHAEVRQRLRVAAGASLEVWPELLIPQRGARYHQRTTIELEPGAELLFFERLAPGRTAMGETFAFTELRLELDVRRMHGRLLLRERSHLAPGSPVLEALTRRFPGAYYASAVLCGCYVLASLARPAERRDVDRGQRAGGRGVRPEDGGSRQPRPAADVEHGTGHRVPGARPRSPRFAPHLNFRL
jgi:urease accessory protein